MTLTEWVLLSIMSISSLLVAYGVLLISVPAGFIVLGVLLATVAALFLEVSS